MSSPSRSAEAEKRFWTFFPGQGSRRTPSRAETGRGNNPKHLKGGSVAGETRSLIAHLFRRAAFGARPDELDYYTQAGYSKAVEDLLSGAPLMGGEPSIDEAGEPINQPVQNLRGRVLAPALNDIQTVWLRRMVTTTAPLVERMTLFLHDHWATAYRPGDHIDTPELSAQNDLFRVNALGNWKSLCHSMIGDVALSCWLDNDVNKKAHPNENLAREFMELFTLGPGNYTEQDVRGAARALTGYTVGYNLDVTGPRKVMLFKAADHDNTANNMILGMGPANFMPHDFVDIALMQEAAPLFLARKLIETFATPTPTSTFVRGIAGVLKAGWELRSALSAIFTSTEFTSQSARAGIVRSPAEFVAGGLRALNRTSSDDIQRGIAWMGQAGQVLYDPPNVGGWPVNNGWAGAGGILARYNAAVALADLHVAQQPLLHRRTRLRATAPAGWGEIFGITELAPATRSAMEGYMRDAKNKADIDALDAAMITLTVSSPDFSLA